MQKCSSQTLLEHPPPCISEPSACQESLFSLTHRRGASCRDQRNISLQRTKNLLPKPMLSVSMYLWQLQPNHTCGLPFINRCPLCLWLQKCFQSTCQQCVGAKASCLQSCKRMRRLKPPKEGGLGLTLFSKEKGVSFREGGGLSVPPHSKCLVIGKSEAKL